ncbi:uncharacterized protein [Dermacentor albipictus]|uniref:uncharacterized protein isoform X2 n=1 Tax=Dermacentor albipictus TaxID=60249 RepID=UPI0038FC99E3
MRSILARLPFPVRRAETINKRRMTLLYLALIVPFMSRDTCAVNWCTQPNDKPVYCPWRGRQPYPRQCPRGEQKTCVGGERVCSCEDGYYRRHLHQACVKITECVYNKHPSPEVIFTAKTLFLTKASWNVYHTNLMRCMKSSYDRVSAGGISRTVEFHQRTGTISVPQYDYKTEASPELTPETTEPTDATEKEGDNEDSMYQCIWCLALLPSREPQGKPVRDVRDGTSARMLDQTKMEPARGHMQQQINARNIFGGPEATYTDWKTMKYKVQLHIVQKQDGRYFLQLSGYGNTALATGVQKEYLILYMDNDCIILGIPPRSGADLFSMENTKSCPKQQL